MSGVLSLREKVAQAELDAKVYATAASILQNGKLLDRQKTINPRKKTED
jgi:hypothetical protein